MTIVFLPIKPNYAFKIIQGEKRYEFRKNKFSKSVDMVVIYATNPEKKIIGCFKIEKIIVNNPRSVWKKFSENSGISEKLFFDYFNNREIAIAIKISNIYIFKKYIDPRKIWKNFSIPQSFKYLTSMQFNELTVFEPELYHWSNFVNNYNYLA